MSSGGALPLDDTLSKCLFGGAGTALGAIGTAFFRWLIDRGRQHSDDARYAAMEKRFVEIDKALTRCRKRESYFRSLHEQGLQKIIVLEATNTRQQAEIDLMKQQMSEMRHALDSTLIKLAAFMMPPDNKDAAG